MRRVEVEVQIAVQAVVEEPEVGNIYDGTVVKIMDFGAFVNFMGSRDGLVHISEMAPNRVEKVTDVVKEGDKVKVKYLGADNRGKMKLSMKRVNQETGEEIPFEDKAHGGDHKDHGERKERKPRKEKTE